MNSSAKIILGTCLAAGLAGVNLAAQSALPFGNLPLWFEAGATGQFTAHGSRSEFVISASGAEFALQKASGETARCNLQFIGANPTPRISGDQMLTGKISHFTGNQPALWQAGLPTFAKVLVENVYPGINVLYYGNQNTLEYDFNLAAGVNPSVITLHFDGAENISLNPRGELVVQVNAGKIVQHTPVAYQMIQGSRQEIAATYKIMDRHTAAFALGEYDHSQPLVIDPVLSYSSYYGGNYGETAWSIAVNPTDGSVYVAGQTFSTKSTNNIPFSTPGALQTNFLGGSQAGDAFIARFDKSGTNLIYATYLGGSADDSAYAIAVDDSGNAFIAGATSSTNFPIKNPIPGGNKIGGQMDNHVHTYATDAFLAKLDSSGSNLISSTYIGGNSSEAAYGIALDSNDNAYITGFTFSTNFPVTTNAFQTRMACSNTVYINANAFVSVLTADGSHLSYSTFIGGTNYDVGRAIAYNNGRVFVTGYTISTNFPSINYLTNNEPRFKHLNGDTNANPHVSGFPDAFVTAFDASTPNLSVLYSTFLGGTNNDVATSIAADASGNAFVAGYTCSTNFPYTTTNVPYLNLSFVATNNNTTHYTLATNGFLTKITWDGSRAAIGYSAMFGGKGVNVANGVALDPLGNAYVIGSATCTNFSVTTNNISGYLSATNNDSNKGKSDAYVIAFNPNATALLYSAYVGGWGNDFGNAIAVDIAGNAYIAGGTSSTNFPAVNARQPHLSGTNDMFIAKITADDLLALSITSQASGIISDNARAVGSQPPSAPSVTLKWKMFPADYDVESSTDMTSSNWQVVPQNPSYSNGWYNVNLPTTNGVQFFRLHKR